jgi:serine/threonine protein kinase
MAQSDKRLDSDAAAPLNGPVDHQDTVLLSVSDLPEPQQATAEVPARTTTPGSVAESPAHLSSQALSVLSQRYDILGEAGHGSMGNVYKARDRETGEVVALKLLKPEISSDQAMMDRFKNELLFARKITHKNVCRVHEFNRLGGIAYTSMEFVEGESLRQVLNRFGGVPVRKALDLAQQICSGLQEAHAQGIVHRDLKPENVMLDAQGNVKIMDFGIARSMEAGTRLTGSMVGTPAYMAPEQVAGKPVDYRTDVYSLGLILYEVFTGTPAFHAENAVAVALKQMRESPRPPHEIESTIPVGIERAILRCLEKEPTRRFQSVAELQKSLKSPGGAETPSASSAPPALLSGGQPARAAQVPSHPLYGASALSAAQPKRTSPVAWVFLVLLLLAGGVVAAAHWPEMKQRVQKYYTPPTADAPLPPDFALNTTTDPSPIPEVSPLDPTPSTPAAPQSVPAKTAENGSDQATQSTAIDKPAAASASGAPVPTPKRAPAAQNSETDAAASDSSTPAPEDVQKRADKAFGQNQPVDAPPVNDHTPSYVWVGRYEREDRAQQTAKKIEELGLPVAVMPRQGFGNSTFYVVVTGPFGSERISSVMDWLKTQGFLGVRLIKNPLAPGRPGTN